MTKYPKFETNYFSFKNLQCHMSCHKYYLDPFKTFFKIQFQLWNNLQRSTHKWVQVPLDMGQVRRRFGFWFVFNHEQPHFIFCPRVHSRSGFQKEMFNKRGLQKTNLDFHNVNEYIKSMVYSQVFLQLEYWNNKQRKMSSTCYWMFCKSPLNP